MECISYSVNDLSADQRHVFEGVFGQPLRADQRVVVQLVDAAAEATPPAPANQSIDVGMLPNWCAVFTDMSDEEFANVEGAILTRADLSRSWEAND
jgi:hypothetical protein